MENLILPYRHVWYRPFMRTMLKGLREDILYTPDEQGFSVIDRATVEQRQIFWLSMVETSFD